MTGSQSRRGGRGTAGVLPRIGNGSLAEQTTRALLEAIMERRFPGDRLPNEPALAEQLGVSRTTIRTALQTLERLGVVSRAPARGTQVRPHIGRESILLHRLIGFRGMLEAGHDDVRIEERMDVREHGTEPAMQALGLDAATPMVVHDKTIVADGRPAVHLFQEVPLEYVAEDARRRLTTGRRFDIPDSIFEFSRSWPGREIDHSVVELVPAVVPDDPDFPLDLAPGTPHIVLREIHYSAANEAVAYSREIVNDELIRFRLVRSR
ncbi:UTRA domain-containing protein [Thermomonospora echinospora]|uniref:UTRA domain-containing protein n=1 Tax=Thermomonospora echinospora TaxID=1992 RepID=A0A1H6E337_9ACTN|nr:GntR family transcriptional regulator [Thermomonospora echinospora]SEG91957.1 UTRA domain-containing protein [Thermomonospora echinospora]